MNTHPVTAGSVHARETHRAAVRAAIMRTGISFPELARALSVREHLVDAWMRVGAPNVMPAWALDRLRALRADFAAALAQELGGNDTGDGPDVETNVLSLVRAYGEALHVVAAPARRTPEGARAALVALARVEGAHARVVPALRRAA